MKKKKKKENNNIRVVDWNTKAINVRFLGIRHVPKEVSQILSSIWLFLSGIPFGQTKVGQFRFAFLIQLERKCCALLDHFHTDTTERKKEKKKHKREMIR
jgi:hypothetical protein